MSKSLVKSLSWLALISAVLAPNAARAAGAGFDQWTTVTNARHGFKIAFPTVVFENTEQLTTDAGRLFVSKDGRARLMVGAFANEDKLTLADYRKYLLEGQYALSAIDYAPVRKRWFVLSGEREGVMFYERVSFTCGGTLINSWAMFYPVAERNKYDRIVEAVAPTYTPGACD